MVRKLIQPTSFRFAAVLTLFVWCWGAISTGSAQTKNDSDETPAQRDPSPLLKDGTLSLDARLWLPDDNKSSPKLVPGFSIGNFLDVVEGRFPLFTLEQVSVRAKVKARHVDLEAQFNVNLHATPQQQAIAIPLRLENCQLVEPVKFEDSVQQTIEVSSKQGGYVWHLQLKDSVKTSVRLVAQTMLTVDQDRQQLTLTLPNSPCLIELELPKDATDVRLGQQSSVLVSVVEESTFNKAVIRSTGDITISWRIGDAPQNLAPLEVLSLTRFEFDNPNSMWTASSNLDIRRTNRDLQKPLLIRLPPGARWLPSPSYSESYAINATASSGTNSNEPQGANQVSNSLQPVDLLVRFLRNEEQYRMPIQWEWRPPPEASSQGGISIPGIVLPDADRHEGRVDISMPSFYTLLDQRIGEGTELENQRNEIGLDRKLYAFRFSRQPFSLNARIGRDSALATVRPTYLVEVDQGKLKLTAWIHCSFEPYQKLMLGLRFQDWSLASAESVTGSGSNLRYEALSQTRLADGTLQVGLNGPEATVTGKRSEHVWRLVAFMPQKIGHGTSVSFSVPELVRYRPDEGKPDVDHGSGVLMVAAAPNLVLRWDETHSRSLLSDSLSSTQIDLIGAELSNRTTLYRFQAGGDAIPNWRAVAEVLPQQIVVEQQVDCRVELDQVALRQQCVLQIDHVPLSKLEIGVSRVLQDLRVTVNDQECGLRLMTEGQESSSTQQFQLVGTDELIGRHTIVFSSRLPMQEPTRVNSGVPLEIPVVSLMLPGDTRRLQGEIQLSHSRELEIWHQLGPGPSQALQAIDERGVIPFAFAAQEDHFPIELRRMDRVPHHLVQVDRAWLQTAINGSDRRDRFCAQLRTVQRRLTLNVPGANPQIFVNGQLVVPFQVAMDRFQIDLPESTDGVFTLDIWTWPSGAIDWISPHEIATARIEDAQDVNQFYWQLITPYVHHLAVAPTGLFPEWQWAWNGFWWSRQSRMEQVDLENWIGVSNQPAVAKTSNRYLLSSFGTPKNFQCWTVSRLLLWFPVGAVSILATLLAISIRVLRSPFVLVTIASLFAGLAMVWPDLGILIGQTFLVSVGLVAMMIVTRAAMDARVRRRSVFTTRPQSTADRGSERQSGARPTPPPLSSTQARAPVSVDGGP